MIIRQEFWCPPLLHQGRLAVPLSYFHTPDAAQINPYFTLEQVITLKSVLFHKMCYGIVLLGGPALIGPLKVTYLGYQSHCDLSSPPPPPLHPPPPPNSRSHGIHYLDTRY
jgi:hypothetical protein